MNFYQIFLPVVSLLYMLIIFVLRSFIIWKKTGTNPLVFGSTDNPHDYLGRVYKVVVICTLISISCYSFLPGFYSYLVPVYYLNSEILRITGLALLVSSFLWTSIAQYQMSVSWRIGIDYNSKTKLVRHGLFRFSRNPIFLGVLFTYLGIFLITPNMLSISILCVTYVTIQTQVRLEEAYLESAQGAEYLNYKSTIRRWL